ncbi:MAG: hypothetical protein EHM13_10455 [Acidobacteria bacterium]|nr:MAG: hypothetical protein EHM13_10455 [Acidobacteriota bacterium]
MEGPTDRLRRWARALRCTARIWSVACVALLAEFVVSELLDVSGWNESLGSVLVSFGISTGLILAWRWERLGGSITLGILLAYYVIPVANTGALPSALAGAMFAAPGVLFLVSSTVSRMRTAAPVSRSHLARRAAP